MTLHNNKSNKTYENCSAVFIAKMIGVHPNTVNRWKKDRKVEHYNDWTIYLDTEKVKCEDRGIKTIEI